MRIDGAIFDLDGTLLDTMASWDELGANYLRSLGIIPTDGLGDIIKLMTIRQAAEYFKSEFSLSSDIAQIQKDINKTIEDFYLNSAQAKKGAAELLENFKKNGVHMCILTASDRHLAEAALSRLGLRHYFEAIITCTEFGSGKDKPDIFLHTLQVLGTEKVYTPVFEDAVHAIKTAKSAGFPVVAVYDKSFADSAAKIKENVDIYLNTLSEWRHYFE